MTFNVHHVLTHDVVDHDVSVLAEGDVELVNSRIGIDAHVRVVVHFRNTDTDAGEQVVQLVGEALVELTGDDPKTGERRVRNGETNMGDFLADAFRIVLDTDICIVNGGAIRNSIKTGVFTYNDLLKAFPFGNMCTVIEATGQQIADALEVGVSAYPGEHGAFMQVSGMTFTIDSGVPSGVTLDAKGNFAGVNGERRVKDIMINGKPIDMNGKYTVGGITYVLKDGGNGLVMFKQSKLLKDGIMTDVDAIMEYVQNHLNAKIKEGYENPYGAGRITIK